MEAGKGDGNRNNSGFMGTADNIEGKNSQLFLIYPLLNFETIMTGPNDSSRAMYMLSRTSVKTVGSKKNPADTASPHCDVSAAAWRTGMQVTLRTCPLHLLPSAH